MSDQAGDAETRPDNAGDKGEATSGDYITRIQTEPEFAAEEVRKKDRFITEVQGKYNSLKDLETYVQAAGSVEELVALATEGYQAKQARQQAEQAPKVVDEEDEIYDPELKTYAEKQASELEELRRSNQELVARLNKTEVASMKSTLEENLTIALDRFKDDPETLEEAQQYMLKVVEQHQAAATNGDGSAQATLNQLAGADGAKTLRMMTLDIYDRFVEKKLAAASTNPNDEVMRRATDDKSTTRASPEPTTVAVESGVRVSAKMIKEKLEEVARKMGKDPDSLFH